MIYIISGENMLEPGGIKILMKELQKNQISLTSLELGIIFFIEYDSIWIQLLILGKKIEGNSGIDLEDCKSICQMLKSNDKIVDLDISDNDIGDEVFDSLVFAWENINIRNRFLRQGLFLFVEILKE